MAVQGNEEPGANAELLQRLRRLEREKLGLSKELAAQRSRRAALLALHAPGAGAAERRISLRLPGRRLELRLAQEPNLAQAGLLWPSGVALAEHLPLWPEVSSSALAASALRGRRVLELGCGVAALPAHVASCELGAEVLATDKPEVLGLAQANAERIAATFGDGLQPPRFASYVWSSDAPMSEPYDLVLGADLLYDPDTHVDLVNTLASAVARPDGVLLLAYEARDSLAESDLFSMLYGKGFSTPLLQASQAASEGVSAHEVRIVELQHRETAAGETGDAGLYL